MNKILLVFGGDSVEHEISIITALQISNKYYGKYKLLLCYHKNGEFYLNKNLNKIDYYKNLKPKLRDKIIFKANKKFIKQRGKKIFFDAVWIVEHGKYCEDGTLYSFFKTLNIDVIAENLYSATIGHDKVLAKKLACVNTLKYVEIEKNEFFNNKNKLLTELYDIGFPIITKPSDLGSSIGVYSAKSIDEFIENCSTLFKLTNKIIVEKQLTNFEEFNIALFKKNNEYILSEIEKVSSSHLLSYEDKYINDEKSLAGQNKELPAKIPSSLKKEIEDSAIKIYKNLHASLVVRIDFLFDNETSKLYFNEINNIPGSLAYYLFEHKGIKINQLIDNLLDEGLSKIDDEKQLLTNFENNILKYDKISNAKNNK